MTGRPAISPSAQDLTRASWQWFERMGWAAADWEDLDDLTTWDGVPLGLHLCVRQWLRQPPTTDVGTVTPADVRQTFALYGQRTPAVLTAYAAGASHRFVAAVLAHQSDGSAVAAWSATQLVHLTEPEATGWALTGHLFTDASLAARSGLRMIAGRFTYWTEALGRTSYLYVLAGVDFAEATALKDAGQSPSQEQLRVMAALNGHTLPAGV